MRKRILSLMLAMVMLCAFVPCVASAATSGTCGDNLTWTLEDGTLTISGTGDMEDYSWSNSSPWFDSRSYITSIVIGSSVTSIGERAFHSCSGLTSITIPDSVTSIGEYAFDHCISLTSITIPDSVTSIGNEAFANCGSLLIDVDKNNTAYSSDDGVLFNKDKTEIVAYAKDKIVTEYTIPDSVTSIGYGAFEYCSGLTSITIPDSVTSIGWAAFYWCSGLTSITIPDSVTSIGMYAFSDCSGLTSVTIPDSVTSIGRYAFAYCSGLTSITIPNGVTSIGNSAFRNCSSLTEINVDSGNANYMSDDGVLYDKDKTKIIQYPAGKTDTAFSIPDSVTSIGDYAFFSCSSLTSITIPNGVTSIGECAFYDCTGLTNIKMGNGVTSIGESAFEWCNSLTEINVDSGNANYMSDDGVLYDKDKTKIIQYPAGKTDTAFSIPDGVTSIGESAFYECGGLTSITIPDSVTSIGEWAFYGCHGLTSITIPDSVTSIGEWAFYGCTGLTSITIPDSVTSIGEYAFYYCTALTDVYYTDSKEQWSNITIGYDNDSLTTATIHYLIDDCFTVSNGTVTNTDSVDTHTATIIIAKYTDGVFSGFAQCEEVTFAAGEEKTFDVPENGKLFVWDSLEGMRPLTK